MAWSDEARQASIEARRANIHQHPLAKANAHEVHKSLLKEMKGFLKHSAFKEYKKNLMKGIKGKGRTKAIAGALGYSSTGGQSPSYSFVGGGG
jgi:hypothetical protein